MRLHRRRPPVDNVEVKDLVATAGVGSSSSWSAALQTVPVEDLEVKDLVAAAGVGCSSCCAAAPQAAPAEHVQA